MSKHIGSSLVTHDDSMLMELKCTDSPHLADRLLNSMTERLCFVMAIHHNQHLLSREHSAHTYRESGLRHEVDITAKETAVSDNGISSERLLARTRSE